MDAKVKQATDALDASKYWLAKIRPEDETETVKSIKEKLKAAYDAAVCAQLAIEEVAPKTLLGKGAR